MTIVDRASNISTTHKCELLLAVGLLAAATVGKRRFDLDQQRIRYFKAGSAALFAHTWASWSWWEGRVEQADAFPGIGGSSWAMWAGIHFQAYVETNTPRKSFADAADCGNINDLNWLYREFPGHQIVHVGSGSWAATCSYTGSDRYLWQLDRTANLARDLITRKGWTGLNIPSCFVQHADTSAQYGSNNRYTWVQEHYTYTLHDPGFRWEWNKKCANPTADFKEQVGQLIDFIVATDWRNVEHKEGEFNVYFRDGKLNLIDLRDINGPIKKLEWRRWKYSGLKSVFDILPLKMRKEYIWRVPLLALQGLWLQECIR